MIRIANNTREDVATGQWCRVEFAVRLDGSKWAKVFLEGIKSSSDFHGKGVEVERKLRTFFQQVANIGRCRKSSQFGPEQDGFHAFKLDAFNHLIRIPCFKHAGAWVLTHGFCKKGAQRGKGKWRPSDIATAKLIMREHIQQFPV